MKTQIFTTIKIVCIDKFLEFQGKMYKIYVKYQVTLKVKLEFLKLLKKKLNIQKTLIVNFFLIVD